MIQAAGPSPLASLVEDYLAAARARGLSRATLENSYGYPLRHVFIPWCDGEGIRQLSDLGPRSLDRLSAQLLDVGGKRGALSRHSVHTYMRAINRFLTWAREEGEDVGVHAQLPKLPKKLIDVLDRDEIQSMEDAAKTERDKLVIRVLADTGIRVGELVSLRTTDIVQRDRNYFLRVRGKGGKERLVPIPQLYRRLQRYAERGRSVDATSNRIFISHRQAPNGEYAPLTTSGVLQLIKNVAHAARVEKRVYPHLFRHSYATWALSRGMNPIMLAQILGHSSLAMIQNVYSHLSPSDAYEAMLRALTTGD